MSGHLHCPYVSFSRISSLLFFSGLFSCPSFCECPSGHGSNLSANQLAHLTLIYLFGVFKSHLNSSIPLCATNTTASSFHVLASASPLPSTFLRSHTPRAHILLQIHERKNYFNFQHLLDLKFILFFFFSTGLLDTYSGIVAFFS